MASNLLLSGSHNMTKLQLPNATIESNNLETDELLGAFVASETNEKKIAFTYSGFEFNSHFVLHVTHGV